MRELANIVSLLLGFMVSGALCQDTSVDLSHFAGLNRRIQGVEATPVNYPRRTTLVDLLRSLRASTLVELMERTNMADVLQSSGPYTVFAPTDDAFDRLSRAAQRQLRKNPDLLRHLLLYHISSGRVMSRDLKNELRIPTLFNNKTVAVRLYASKKPSVNQASITVPDAIASNGVVHMVSDVIFPIPSGTIMDVISGCPAFHTINKLMKLTGLDENLTDSDSPITLFAPTDEAFQLAPALLEKSKEEELDEATKEELKNFVQNHMVKGSYFSSSLQDGQELVTEADLDLQVTVRHNKLREVGIARVTSPDIAATNGVVHAVDRVLQPMDLCPIFT